MLAGSYYLRMKKIYLVFSYIIKVVPIAIGCYAFDFVLKSPILERLELGENHHTKLKAVCDNVGHGVVASITWLAVLEYQCNTKNLIDVLLCGMIASFVDVDHFIHAGSLHIEDALNLSSRPPLHNTSIIILLLPLFLLLYVYSKLNSWFHNILLIVVTAIISHHLRDGNRRGLWFWPFGNTKPLAPEIVYIVMICLLPMLVWKVQCMLDISLDGTRQTLDV